MRNGQPVCVVETSKAAIEIVSQGRRPGKLAAADTEVELGSTIGLVAQNAAELETATARRERGAPARQSAAGPREHDAQGGRARRGARHRPQPDREGGLRHRRGRRGDVVAATAPRPARPSPTSARRPLDGKRDAAGDLLGRRDVGRLDEAFLAGARAPIRQLRRALVRGALWYRATGASVGEGVLSAPEPRSSRRRSCSRTASDRGQRLVRCDEVFADGVIALVRDSKVSCRRACIGAGIWVAPRQIGGGGPRDPWATFADGDALSSATKPSSSLPPVLIGREAFLDDAARYRDAQHRPLDPRRLREPLRRGRVEDRAQIGVGTVVYAGCRIGSEAIVASNSYVVVRHPAGTLAGRVPPRSPDRPAAAPVAERQAALRG